MKLKIIKIICMLFYEHSTYCDKYHDRKPNIIDFDVIEKGIVVSNSQYREFK